MNERLNRVLQRASISPGLVTVASTVFAAPYMGRRRLGDPIVGSPSPNYVPVWWHPSCTKAEHIDLVRLTPDPRASSTPKGWTTIGMIAVERQRLSRAQEIHPGARLAAFYALGSTLMVGLLPKDQRLGVYSEELCALGARTGPVEVFMGVGLAKDGRIIPLHTTESPSGLIFTAAYLEENEPDLQFV